MSVLTIRSHRRFAVRLPVELRKKGVKPAHGLLIEISQQGARISGLGRRKFDSGEDVTFETSDGMTLSGKVRWAHDGLAGVKLDRSMHAPEITRLVNLNRREHAFDEESSDYGT